MTSQVRLNFEDGESISSFISFRLRETFSDPIQEFDFVAEPPEGELRKYQEKLQKGNLCSVLVDGKPQAALAIETVDTTVSAESGVSFSVSAVSPLKNVYQSNVDPRFFRKIQADTPLLEVVADILEPFGIGEVFAQDDIAVIRTKTGKNPKATPTAQVKVKKGELQGNSDETVYAFIARITTRLGIMLRMDAVLGSCFLTAPHYDGEPLYGCKVAREGAGPTKLDRFFGDVLIHDTNNQQFSFCEVSGNRGQASGETFSGPPRARVTTAELNSRRPPFRGTGALTHKPLFRTAKACKDAVEARSCGKLLLGLNAQHAFFVKGSVDGLVSMDGTPWSVDTLGRVYIETLGFDETMWLAERTMSADSKGGQRTELVWIPPGNFVIGEVPS